MKRLLTVVAVLSAILAGPVSAQSSVHPKDVKGVWHMTFELADQATTDGERVALHAVSGLLNWIDIRFEFLPDNRLKVVAGVVGEEEVEYSDWYVNDRRELVLGDSEHFKADDTVWLFEDGRLAAFEYRDGERVRSSEGVYLEMES